jgi:hypothetical protein
MDIILESDTDLDNDMILDKLREIIPEASTIKITIRSKRQGELLKLFDKALDKDDATEAVLALNKFKETLFAPDGTATLKLMNIQMAGLGG